MPQQGIVATATPAVAATPNKNRVFVGKAWLNRSKNGLDYTNITFDRGMEVTVKDKKTGLEYVIPEGASIQGFPNTKREGKKDADLRLSFRLAEGS